ncbi:MAG: peptidase domain-containing ABC transporter [Treponema sp.]|nr:peptidase domain-containing ABC transporter [Treponema sp.]
MRYRQQYDSSDCGAACIAMVASYFGENLNIAEVRKKAGTDTEGTNFKGMLDAAHAYNLRARAVKGDSSAIKTSLPTPFIVHMKITRESGVTLNHYVVVKKISKKHICIWDPDPLERKKILSYKDFFEFWTGYAIFFEPDVNLKKTNHKENLLLKFLPVFLPHKKLLFFSFMASVLLLVFGLASSFYYKYLFDEIIYSKAEFSLHTLSAGILLVAIIQCVVSAIRSVLLSHFSFKTDLQLNFSYLAHILNLPVSFFESRKSGEILSRLSDLDKIKQTLSNAAISGVMDFVMIIVSGPILLKISGRLFAISFSTVILASVVSAIFARIYRSYYARTMSQNADVQSFLYESLNGISTIKALNSEEKINSEYENKKMTAVTTSWKLNRIGISQGLISALINGISGILIYWIGSSGIINDLLSFGTLITFNSLLGYFSSPLFRLIGIQNGIQEALVAAQRVGEILELECEKDSDKLYIEPNTIHGHIEFKDVTFSYGSRKPIYEHFDLEIQPDSWTAFVGQSGCGKSTIVKLILKFYKPQSGKIFFDGNNIEDIDATFLREKIGYVPQDIFLFSGTVRENIALHRPDSSLEEIMNAAKNAGAHDFIENLPQRYETVLGEHGGGLSGGEKQRLALARALLGNPSLIILDEATSSLDTVSEMQIHNILKKIKSQNISVILIAHRLSTVEKCDRIFVMESGKIVQSGTHLELINQSGLYKELWQKKG